jgi:ATP-binding cassette subfamily F protein uup
LEELPRKIEAMEEEHAAWISRMVDPKELARDPAGLVALRKQVEELERQMEEAYARWQELEKVRVAVEGK